MPGQKRPGGSPPCSRSPDWGRQVQPRDRGTSREAPGWAALDGRERACRDRRPPGSGSNSSATASLVSACRKRKASPVHAEQHGTHAAFERALDYHAGRQPRRLPAAAASRTGAPRTAAVCSTRRSSSPRPVSRARTVSAKDLGTPGDESSFLDQEWHPRRPSAAPRGDGVTCRLGKAGGAPSRRHVRRPAGRGGGGVATLRRLCSRRARSHRGGRRFAPG